MEKKRGEIAGFVYRNKGSILDCHCIVESTSYVKRIPFFYSNDGKIKNSLLNKKGKVLQAFDQDGIESKDKEMDESTFRQLGFDLERTWNYTGEKKIIQYNPTTWLYVNKTKEARKTISIRSKEDFLKFQRRVNAGDESYRMAEVILETDLDFNEDRILPVANRRECAFQGFFQGNSHVIRNCRIEEERVGYKALFGYNKGTICNLIIDIGVQGEGNLASLCGYNEGNIYYSGALAGITAKGEKATAAGFVHTNEGAIEKCYTVFFPRKGIAPIIPIGLIATCLIYIGVIAFVAIPTVRAGNRVFAAIEVDPNQQKVQDSDLGDRDLEEKELSFTFNEFIMINKTLGECKLDFVNPATDTNKVVVELQIEDEKNNRITLASSKAIEPGYALDYLKLNEEARGYLDTVSSGYIVLMPYDMDTENKGFINAELPVSLACTD